MSNEDENNLYGFWASGEITYKDECVIVEMEEHDHKDDPTGKVDKVEVLWSEIALHIGGIYSKDEEIKDEEQARFKVLSSSDEDCIHDACTDIAGGLY